MRLNRGAFTPKSNAKFSIDKKHLPADAMKIGLDLSLSGLAARSHSGISYLLHDMFADTVSAGSVNESSAQPGPGTRTATDTNNIISTNGAAAVVNGTAVANDGLVYGQQARTAGRVFLWTTQNRAAVGSAVRQGFSDNALSGSGIEMGIDYGGGGFDTVRIKDGVSVRYVLNLGSGAHRFAAAMRGNGGYLFAKTGSGNWKLIWVYQSGSAAQYPKFWLDSGAVNFQIANVAIPDVAWLPIPLASDAFGNSMATTDGGAHDENGGGGLPWVQQLGSWSSASSKGQVDSVDGTEGIAVATVDTGASDVVIFCEVEISTDSAGIVARYVDEDNYLVAYHDGTNARLDQVVAGSVTNLLSDTASYASHRSIKLWLEGTSARLFYNNAQIGGTATVPSSTATEHGIWANAAGELLDDFQIWGLGTDGEYSQLDSY